MLDFRNIAAAFGRSELPTFDVGAAGEGKNPLIAGGILVKSRQLDFIRCPCGGAHSAEVERTIGRNRTPYYVAYCGETGIPYPVEKTDAVAWGVSVPAILKIIGREFGCPGEPEKRCASLWYLGESGKSIAGRRRQIFFCLRITDEAAAMLPEGSTQILIVGEYAPPPLGKFQDRIFQMHDLLSVSGGEIRFDYDLVESRLAKIETAGEPERKERAIPKNAVQKSREEHIKKFLVDHAMSVRDAYWNAMDRGTKFEMPPRPSCRAIADYIRSVTEGAQSPDQSTVNRTIAASTDKELTLIWRHAEDVDFVREFRRRR